MSRLLSLITLLLLFRALSAQPLKRSISIKAAGQDSAVIHFNDDYYLTEDSCAKIIRYCHFDFKHNLFTGHFKDISAEVTSRIIAEGNYDTRGTKNGLFILNYLNGNPEAKGIYEQDSYYGKWETFYENGRPESEFEIADGEIHVISYWNSKGKQQVKNGKGEYRYEFGSALGRLYWQGKLEDGRPAGKWKLFLTDDISEKIMGQEFFKNREFVSGSLRDFQYSNGSHIKLIDPAKFPFLRAEKLLLSAVACGGFKTPHLIGAQYINGLRGFLSLISDAVTPIISRTNLNGINNAINITGEVSEKGSLINMKQDNIFREDLARQLILRIQNLNLLYPATSDGKPVKQKFTISFVINNGSYYTEIRLLPIKIY